MEDGMINVYGMNEYELDCQFNEHFNKGAITNLLTIPRPLNLFGLNTNKKMLDSSYLPILKTKTGFDREKAQTEHIAKDVRLHFREDLPSNEDDTEFWQFINTEKLHISESTEECKEEPMESKEPNGIIPQETSGRKRDKTTTDILEENQKLKLMLKDFQEQFFPA